MNVPTRDELNAATRKFDESWGGVDEVLYRVCNENPGHTERRAIMTKLIIVERTYAAGAQRLFSPPPGKQAVDLIGDCLEDHGDEVASILGDLAKISEPLGPRDMSAIVDCHGRLTALLGRHVTKKKSARSFCSKYLHFHRPVVPIYDNYCNASLTHLVPWSDRAVLFAEPQDADTEYYRYCVRFLRLYEACHERGVEATVKDFDAFLWQIPE